MKNKKVKNYGFSPKLELKHQSDKDWIVGGLLPTPLFEMKGDILKYLPTGELQNIGEEKMDCVSRAVVNYIETILNYAVNNNLLSSNTIQWLNRKKYFDDNGSISLSDVWVAMMSDTTREGNSLIKPVSVAHEFGMIPKWMLPQLNGFDENYDKDRLTQEMKDIASEFKQILSFNYARANESQFKDLETKGGVVTGGFAWPVPYDGVYPRVDMVPNHSWYNFYYDKYHFSFDNYLDFDGDFIKKLQPDYDFIDIGYKIFVTAENSTPSKTSWAFLETIKKFISSLFKK